MSADPNELVAIHHPLTNQDSIVTRATFDGAWSELGWELDETSDIQPEQPPAGTEN